MVRLQSGLSGGFGFWRKAALALWLPAAACSSTDGAPSDVGSGEGGEALPDAGSPPGTGSGVDSPGPSPVGNNQPSTGGDASSPGGGGDAAGAFATPDAGSSEGIPAADGGTASSGSCPSGPFGNPIPAGAATMRIAGAPPSDAFNSMDSKFGIIESPVWIRDAFYLSEIGPGANPPASRILRVTPAGEVSVAVADSGSNGLATDKDGNLYAGVHKDGSISRVDLASGTVTPVASQYNGARFNSPNDLIVRDDGNIYFSDPDYQSPSPTPQAKTRVYRVAPNRTVSVIDEAVPEPNGMALSLDQKTLYVGSTKGIYAYPVADDGSVGAGRMFVPAINADGISIDCAGNLYVGGSAKGILVFSPSGAMIGGPISVGDVQGVAMANLGGADRKTLFIATLGSGMQKGVFQVGLSIPGEGR